MRIRTLALVLLMGIGLTTGIEAKKKAQVARPVAHKVKVKKYKVRKYKRAKPAKPPKYVR
jgi:hypothetical protein